MVLCVLGATPFDEVLCVLDVAPFAGCIIRWAGRLERLVWCCMNSIGYRWRTASIALLVIGHDGYQRLVEVLTQKSDEPRLGFTCSDTFKLDFTGYRIDDQLHAHVCYRAVREYD